MKSQISENLYKKLQRQYSRRINLDLSRIKKVLQKLGDPQDQIDNVINIIGSDGKNSCLTSLKYFLKGDGHSVNTFTSPHLYDVRERFWLGNKFISIKDIKRFKKIIEKTKIKLTLFELLTCIFVLSVKKTNPDSFNLIESGLLFKKDSTNLWDNPMAQIITNINYQHQEWVFPKTIKEICKQKVGYLSKNTNIYVGSQKPGTLKIIKSFLKKNPSDCSFHNTWRILTIKNIKYYKDKNNFIKLVSKNIHSEGLWDNVGLAIKVALDLGVKANIIEKTVPKIKFEGRVQFIRGKITKKRKNRILVDGCHSYTSSKNLANFLKNQKTTVYGIWGSLKNKNPNENIKNFKGIFKKLITIKIPNETNALSASELKKIALKNRFDTEESKNIKDALNKIPNSKRNLIVIFGSLYLVGYVLSIN